MIYTENIFVCLAAPLLISVFLLEGNARRFMGFFVIGLTVCLLTGYVNSVFVDAIANNGSASLTMEKATVRITPIFEELIKALPVFFFTAVFDPERKDIITVSLSVGIGFATFENVCHITQYGAADFLSVLIRGFSTGVMHTACAAILGSGLALIHRRGRLVLPGSFAVLCAASTVHAIYNLLVSAEGSWRSAGYLLPIATAAGILLWNRRRKAAMDK